MSDQLSLFAPAPKVSSYSRPREEVAWTPERPVVDCTPEEPENTKRAALEAIQPVSGVQRVRVLYAIRSAGAAGRTIGELARELGMRESSVCGRVRELQGVDHEGRQTLPILIRDSGRRRETSSGRSAIVWVAA